MYNHIPYVNSKHRTKQENNLHCRRRADNRGNVLIQAETGRVQGDFGRRRQGRIQGHFPRKPDLAVIDLVMPNMKGLPLVRKLKKDKKLKDIPIIILTNIDSPEERREASELGVLFFLVKPHFLPSEILAIIDEVLFERK